MFKYLAGFIVGAAASWAWCHRRGPVRGFQHLLGREMRRGEPVVAELYRKIEHLEQLFHRLEAKLAIENQPDIVPAASPPPDNRRGRVIRLLNKGCSTEEIMRSTGLARGEVELILSLKEHRRPAENS